MSKGYANDAMIRRLDDELQERQAFVEGLVAAAQDDDRDLTDEEDKMLQSAEERMDKIRGQLERLEGLADTAKQVRARSRQLDEAITSARKVDGQPVEYRSAGAYALDQYQASLGDRPAKERLEVFHRVADHQKTPDNLGVVPDPVIGSVVNFIDAARPIVGRLGPQSMPNATWHRPKVTQSTSVDLQGTAGAAADEKAELVSQKMLITRLTANAVTYGGYVNVSRQNIDFSSPQVLDIVINDLAAQYAIQTEAATADALVASTGPDVVISTSATSDEVHTAVWDAAAQAYNAVKGQGSLFIAASPDRLAQFGPLFQPVNPENQPGEGFRAGNFSQGAMGSISGVPVIMSAGLTGDQAFLLSSSALEVFEQRVGTLQVTEPSVLGVQVAYAGYFTPLTIEDNGIVEFTTV